MVARAVATPSNGTQLTNQGMWLRGWAIGPGYSLVWGDALSQ
jgi:hypothetical protein